MVGQLAALSSASMSNAASTDLILGLGAGGSLVLVVGLTWFAARGSRQAAQGGDRGRAREKRLASVGGRGPDPVPGAGTEVGAGGDGFPPQPYSETEPHSHRPYSRPYQPVSGAQAGGKQAVGEANGSSNGRHHTGRTQLPRKPLPGPRDEQ